MKLDGIQPDAVAYRTMISACEKADRWDEIRSLLDMMKSDGLQRNAGILFFARIVVGTSNNLCLFQQKHIIL